MILFLDIDGVLHPDPPQPDQRLRPLPRLVAILQDFPLVEIVISSLWRERLSLDQLRELFPADLRERIIDATPIAELIDGWLPARREEEIQEIRGDSVGCLRPRRRTLARPGRPGLATHRTPGPADRVCLL